MDLLTTREASEFLKTSQTTMRRWRVTGDGPTYIKIGKSVRYRREDLVSFVDGNARRHTSEEKTEPARNASS